MSVMVPTYCARGLGFDQINLVQGKTCNPDICKSSINNDAATLKRMFEKDRGIINSCQNLMRT